MNREYSTLQSLPNNGEKCLCFGHKTICCKLDMDLEPDWHEVTFKFVLSSYKLKDKFPEDIEDSILEFCHFVEMWRVDNEYQVIGVTKWKQI